MLRPYAVMRIAASAGRPPVSRLCEQELLRVAARHLLDGLAHRVQELRRAAQVGRSRVGPSAPHLQGFAKLCQSRICRILHRSLRDGRPKIGAEHHGWRTERRQEWRSARALTAAENGWRRRESAARSPRPDSKATSPKTRFPLSVRQLPRSGFVQALHLGHFCGECGSFRSRWLTLAAPQALG